jgi:soluble lytic murein transglycosylase-like protein
MTYFAIVSLAAKKVGVSASLLFAICQYESANFTDILVHNDGGSPSVGICMLKLKTAQFLGYKGNAVTLEKNHMVNATYAAKYLAYQESRYGDDWHKLAAAYNAGSYNPSQKVPGCPRNLKYVVRVKRNLGKELQHKMECGKN